MKNNNNYSWRSMTLDYILHVREIFRAGNPQFSEETLEGLSQFPSERLASDTLVAITSGSGIIAAGITTVLPTEEEPLMGRLECFVHPQYLRNRLGARLLSWQMERAFQKAGE